MSVNISLYPHIKEAKKSQDIPLDLFLEGIRSGKWQDQVFPIHKLQGDARAEAKKALPYVTISGKFSERKNAGLMQHSGFICIDLDDVAVNRVRELLRQDKYVYSCFVSASGTGLAVLFKINPDKHLEAFRGLAEYLYINYRLVADEACKDISRPRFVSFDPAIHINPDAVKFTQYPKAEAKGLEKAPSVVWVQSDFDDIVREIELRRIDITGDYRTWIKIAFSLASKLGEPGRSYFHAVSQFSSLYDYESCDRQYTNCLKASGTKIATIASFYYLVKEQGIPIVSEKTRTISQYAAMSKKSKCTPSDAIKQLQDFEQIPESESSDIVKQVFESDIKISLTESPVDSMEIWLKQNYDLRRNSITRFIENRGVPLDETALNTVDIDCLKVFPKLRFDVLSKLIRSSFVPTYNPLIEFLEQNKERQPKGTIEALMNTIKTDTGMEAGNFCPDYPVKFGTKWLIGLIASIYGGHNPLMLVLSGNEQNTGKTQWWRRLLPERLKDYYAESKLDAGVDDYILMTKKLIIMDDEMGGKSKKEASLLKTITSKQVFSLREPYGRSNVDLRRLANLGGTTNETEIINDPTGNRRTIPINVLGIDHGGYNLIDKTDLLIEAYHLFKAGHTHDLDKDDIRILGENTDTFKQASLEADLLNGFYERPERQEEGGFAVFMTGTDIKVVIERATMQRLNHIRIGMELKRSGWEVKTRRRNGQPVKGYWVIPRTGIL